MSRRIVLAAPEDLGVEEICAVAAGASVEMTPELAQRIDKQRARMLDVLAGPQAVYGVNTGMGAASTMRLTEDQQSSHQARLLLARQVGTPPWMDYSAARAAVAARVRTFLNGDAGVSAALCQAFIDLLNHGLAPALPDSCHGAAGEIIPASHMGGALAGHGRLIDAVGGADNPRDAAEVLNEVGLAPYEFGPKEGVATIQGTPVAMGVAACFAQSARMIAHQHLLVLAGTVRLTAATRDPYDPQLARGDSAFEKVLHELGVLLGPPQEADAIQAPVSFRVTPPAIAHLERSIDQLEAATVRGLVGVSDSPAFIGDRFVGTTGFDGFALAAGFDAVRLGLLHLGELAAARLHRLLDERINGYSPQLSAEPGAHAGLVTIHKGAVGVLHRALNESAPLSLGMRETSFGQEDAQSFALEAYAATVRAADSVRHVLASELLALVQVLRLNGNAADVLGHPDTVGLLTSADTAAAPGVHDRRWGEDITALVGILERGEVG